MIITATFLLIAGIITAVMGAKLFKLLLPLLGFIIGFMVGFSGFQGIFGNGAVSTTMAIVIALCVGILMALLSFLFFDLAVIVFTIALGAMAFSYLGVALGLSEDGLIVFLMAIAGGILAGMFALRVGVANDLVIALTSLLGVGYILVAFMLLVGDVSTTDLAENGVVSTIIRVVDQSFLWFFVWVGGSLISMRLQYRLMIASLMTTMFELDPEFNTKRVK